MQTESIRRPLAWGLLVACLALGACKGELPGGPELPADPSRPGPQEPQPPIMPPVPYAPRVVGITYDTGTNPFHPCFRRPDWPSTFDAIPEIRGVAKTLRLDFAGSYAESLDRSRAAINEMLPFTLYVIEGTNLLVYTGRGGGNDLVDVYPHGAAASSQVTCPEFGLAPEGYLVIANWYRSAGGVLQDLTGVGAADLARLETWSAMQPWIDVIHLNIQQIFPTVVPTGTAQSIDQMVAAGKLVVIAAGNGFGNAGGHIPTETVDYYRNPGVLAAGANDGTGYVSFSNLDPHTVMDGCATQAADWNSYGSNWFGGTSSSSPRTAGYAMELLYRLRRHYGAAPGTAHAALLRLAPAQRPATGPLADGLLTVHELHEVVRKTADPRLPASWLDGDYCLYYFVPRPVDPQGHDYHRVGYGKLTDDTLAQALDVLTGKAPMPLRPTEDAYYGYSRSLRDLWP